MEQHLADLQRAQRKKRVMADARALEKGDLRAPQASQELPNEVNGTLAGTSVSGGALGLERVVGAGGKPRKAHMSGKGVVSDLHIPIVSDIARLFGLGRKQGRKAREDERLGMEVKGLKNEMDGGAYADPAFGVINQPAGSSKDLLQVAGEAPMGAGYSGAGMARKQGKKMAKYLHETHGEEYMKHYTGGFLGTLLSVGLPLLGNLLSGKGEKEKWIQEATSHMKEGAFTQQALHHHMTPEEFAEEVLKHPKKYTLRTRRRAQFIKNVTKRGGGGSDDEYSDEELREINESHRQEQAVRRAEAAAAAAAPAQQMLRLPMGPAAGEAAMREGMALPAAAGATAVQAAQAVGQPMYGILGAVPARRSPKSPSPPARGVAAPGVGILGEVPARRSPKSPSPSKTPEKQVKKKKGGAVKPGDRRAARAVVVKRVMKEQNLSLPQASKYVKEHGLF